LDNIDKLYHELLNRVTEQITSKEYQEYHKFYGNAIFQHSEDIMEQVRNTNSKYRYVASSDNWEREFGKYPKNSKEKPFKVKATNNQVRWLYDSSQMKGGKPFPGIIYKNVKGKVENYDKVFSILVECCKSEFKVLSEEGSGYYTGVGEDSYVKDNAIVLRAGLSEAQTILALVREIIRSKQQEPIVVEASSYMVCKFINLDTSAFSIGYLAELLGFSSAKLTEDNIKQSIKAETKLLIGYLSLLYEKEQQEEQQTEEIETLLENKEKFDKDTEEKEKKDAQEESKISTLAAPIEKESEITHGKSEGKEILGGYVLDIADDLKIMQVPDNTVDVKYVHDVWGYNDPRMLIMGRNVAMEYFVEGAEIYGLKQRNEEFLINEEQEMKPYSYFGITIAEWAKIRIEKIRKMIGDFLMKIKEEKKESMLQTMLQEETSMIFEPEFDEIVHTVEKGIDYNEELKKSFKSFINNQEEGYKKIPLFKDTSTPFFSKNKEMLGEITGWVLESCISAINKILESSKKIVKQANFDKKSGKKVTTQKTTYDIKKVVETLCTQYSYEHIAYILEKEDERKKIKASRKIIIAFQNYFEIHKEREAKAMKNKKESPEERIKRAQLRMKEHAEAKKESQEDSESDDSVFIADIIAEYKKEMKKGKSRKSNKQT